MSLYDKVVYFHAKVVQMTDNSCIMTALYRIIPHICRIMAVFTRIIMRIIMRIISGFCLRYSVRTAIRPMFRLGAAEFHVT